MGVTWLITLDWPKSTTGIAHFNLRTSQVRKRGKIPLKLSSHGREGKSTSKKNVDGRSTSSHDNKKFRTRSMEKRRGMAFGFRKTATAVKKPDR